MAHPLLKLPRGLPASTRSAAVGRPVRCLSTTAPRPATPLYMLSRLSNSRETQHFTKRTGHGVTNHVPAIEAIKSSEVDPFVTRDTPSASTAAATASKPQSLTDFHFFPSASKPTPRIAAGSLRASPPLPLTTSTAPTPASSLGVSAAADQPTPSAPGPKEQLARARLANAILSPERAVLRDSLDGAGSSPALRQALFRRFCAGDDASVDAKLLPAAAEAVAAARREDVGDALVLEGLRGQVQVYKALLEEQVAAGNGAGARGHGQTSPEAEAVAEPGSSARSSSTSSSSRGLTLLLAVIVAAAGYYSADWVLKSSSKQESAAVRTGSRVAVESYRTPLDDLQALSVRARDWIRSPSWNLWRDEGVVPPPEVKQGRKERTRAVRQNAVVERPRRTEARHVESPSSQSGKDRSVGSWLSSLLWKQS